MSAPACQRSSSVGITSGGSCRSASIITTASPRAWSRPAVIAVWWPKLRDSVTILTRSSAAAISARIAGVSSLEPSSTITSSHGRPSSASCTRAKNARAVPAEAYADAASDDYVDEEAGQRETARRALARIAPHLAQASNGGPRRLLDLGCWVGFLLAEARELGWEAIGIEPSTFASAYAR